MTLNPLDSKARQCAVKKVADDLFAVTSPSGATYEVRLYDEGATANCTCAWGRHHHFAGCEFGCAHMRAVWAYEKDDRNIWKLGEQAAFTYARMRDGGFSESAAIAAGDEVMGLVQSALTGEHIDLWALQAGDGE